MHEVFDRFDFVCDSCVLSSLFFLPILHQSQVREKLAVAEAKWNQYAQDHRCVAYQD